MKLNAAANVRYVSHSPVPVRKMPKARSPKRPILGWPGDMPANRYTPVKNYMKQVAASQ